MAAAVMLTRRYQTVAITMTDTYGQRQTTLRDIIDLAPSMEMP